MRILARYLLASYLNLFATILIVSLVSIVIVEMLMSFDRISEHHQGLPGIAAYFLIRLPSYYLGHLVPIASFAATFLCLGLPARARETTAMKAGGISLQRVCLPILAAAAFLSVVHLGLNETVVLRASREWHRLDARDPQVAFRRGSFWYHRGDAIYNVRDADRAGGTLRGVRVFELGGDGRLRRSIRAELVEVGDGPIWRFRDATVRSFAASDPGAPPRVERVREAALELGRAEDLVLVDAAASSLSLRELHAYVAERDRENRDATRYRTMLHSRLAEPLTVLLFALLALPVGLAVEGNRSLATSALRGVAVVALFYAVRAAGSTVASGGVALAASGPWLVLASFAGWGLWRFARLPR